MSYIKIIIQILVFCGELWYDVTKAKKGDGGSDVLRSRVWFFENLSSVDCGRLPMADILIYAPCFKHGAKDDLGNIEAEAADRNTKQVDF